MVLNTFLAFCGQVFANSRGGIFVYSFNSNINSDNSDIYNYNKNQKY